MSKKLVTLLILVLSISIMLIGCSNTKEASPEIGVSRDDIEDDFEVKKDILETISTDTKYENFKEFKEGSKNNAVKFSKWLNKYNIENEISKDGYSVKNTNTVSNQNGIDYNRVVYLSTSVNMRDGKYFYGSYKVNLVYENHIQEEYNSDNEFIKLIYDIVKTHDKDLTIDELTKELNDYVNGNTDMISFSNNIVNINVSNKNTIKILSMSFENYIAETELDYVVKEYSTIKEYIEDSKNLANIIKQKADQITDVNMVQKSGEEISYSEQENIYMCANLEGKLYQEINIDLDMSGIRESEITLTDNTVKVIYSILEEVYGEKLKEYYTFEEFSTLVEMNTVKKFEDDVFDGIENNGLILPYLENGYISISNAVADKGTVIEDMLCGLVYSVDEAELMLQNFDNYMFANGRVNINIMIPVKAEGLTTYYPQYQDGKYVLDDGTVVEEIDSRR